MHGVTMEMSIQVSIDIFVSFYDISFYSLRECGSFDVACQKAIEQVRDRIKAYGHAFTYIFIDESQDFKESFFKLCELVTEKKCFIAGDIFQSIFEEKKKILFLLIFVE